MIHLQLSVSVRILFRLQGTTVEVCQRLAFPWLAGMPIWAGLVVKEVTPIAAAKNNSPSKTPDPAPTKALVAKPNQQSGLGKQTPKHNQKVRQIK